MNDLLKRLDLLFRSCARCRSWWGWTDLYCERCWAELLLQQSFRLRCVKGHSIWSLWDWQPGPNSLVTDLIYNLKSGRHGFAFSRLVDEFLVQRRCFPASGRPFIFVPAPPQKSGQSDHAGRLAEAFSAEVPSAQLVPALRRVDPLRKQKAVTRTSRRQQKFMVTINLAELGGYRVVFVDDVVTTGSTAQAAWEALGRPLEFEVWCLAWRSRLL